MLDFLKNIFSKEVLGSKSVALAFVALVIAGLIAAAEFVLFSFSTGQTGSAGSTFEFAHFSRTFQLIVAATLIFGFVLIWFLLYVQYNREAEDIYSQLREKLVGTWQVTYELAPGQNAQGPWDPAPVIICKIAINPSTKKLEILFDLDKHPVFTGRTQVIQTISLGHVSENKYSMSYYYKEKQDLTAAISLHILPENEQSSHTDLDVEIFAALSFEDLSTTPEVKLISGQWFDLNGNLIRLFSLISELRQHEDDDRIFRKKLSDATISRDNFASLMGDITFSR
ncbi:hypothetical protein IVA88_02070 [Bradyrhizobium sp. 149]|uniref:hypothetical protein n=1 Tax=Bradyrhizobium sp. 149 TaxID=2782624 RepID=UPI001FF8586F|nr:hypothetical protein [Bradyrhizobium sp. 149]MCK1650226.1 hypothetical protein [Bradyrhizobium sp. 149]